MARDKYLIPFITMAVISVIIASGYLYYKISAGIKGKEDSFKNNIYNSYWYSKAERDSIKKLLIGGWIYSTYNDVLKMTYSPSAALDSSYGFTPYMMIEHLKDNDNYVHIECQDGFHMVYDYNIELARTDSMQFSNIRLSRHDKGVIYDIGKDIQGKYIRCNNVFEYVNSVVISGIYLNVASVTDTIIFKINGQVFGLDKFPKLAYFSKTSQVEYELMLDQFGSKYDRIMLGDYGYSDRGGKALYIYERKDELLNIYQSYSIHWIDDNKGKLLYRLKRIGDNK